MKILQHMIYLALALFVGYAAGNKSVEYHMENTLDNKIHQGVRKYVEQNELMRFNNLGRLILMNEEITDPQELRQAVIGAQNDYIWQLQMWGDTLMANFLMLNADTNSTTKWVTWKLQKNDEMR